MIAEFRSRTACTAACSALLMAVKFGSKACTRQGRAAHAMLDSMLLRPYCLQFRETL
jgi:hypothetical protein